jgi:amino acid adenylation domain-containing protein
MAEPERVRIDTTEGGEEDILVFPASFAQQRLWFLAHLEPESTAYNCHRFIRFTGDLRLRVLEAALQAVVDRHESLRTTFGTSDGETVQVISPYWDFALPVIDLESLPGDRQESEAQRLAQQAADHRFDLRRGPLLKACVIRLGLETTLLLFTQHHIVTDGWSMSTLLGEISTLYQAFVEGRPARLPGLSIQYADFAVWQRERLASTAMTDHLAYWRQHLAGAPEALALPYDRPRWLADQGSRGLVESPVRLTVDLSRAFQGLIQRREATLFMGLLALVEVLLLRWTGQEDFVVGTPVSGRQQVETEALIGFFVNTLALRATLAPGATFSQHLARVRAEVIEAFAHQEIPFEKVVEEVRPDQGRSQAPLFQVLFTVDYHEATQDRAFQLPGLRMKVLKSRASSAKFDLSLFAFAGERLGFAIEYRSDLFEAPTIQRLLAHLENLVAAVVASPEAPLGSLELLSGPERQQLLREWNDAEHEYPREGTIDELFAVEAARRPDAVAVVWRDHALTYGELDRRSGQLATYLRRRGVGPEVPVAVCLERKPEMVIALLGILKTGGAFVPLDLSYPEPRLAFMIEDSGASVLLTERHLAAHLPAFGAAVVLLDQTWPALAQEPSFARPSGGGAGTAYLMYTSGSTGRPKGVRVPHRGVVRLVKQDAYIPLGEEQVFLQAAPVSFDASTLEIWGPLLNGGKLVLYAEEDLSPERLERAIARHAINTLWLTAGLFHQMVDERVGGFSGLEYLLAGGDVLSPSRVEKLLREQPGIRLINGYGPTENTTFTCCAQVTEPPAPGGTIPIGRPIANTRVYVLDRGLQPVPVGAFGELYAGGDGLARDYSNQPELTAAKFVPDPFGRRPGERLYRTGDLVRWLPSGSLEFAGRRDGQVKLRGYRVEPGEIEEILSRHEAVREAAVVVREDRPGDKRLLAYVVPARDDAGLAEELAAALRGQVPGYMVPSAITCLESLPRNSNGKVDRKALLALQPQPAQAGQEEDFTEQDNPTEAVLAEIWSEVLGRERVGTRESFFDLGGHSLLAMQVVSRVRKVFAIDLPVRTLFEAETVSGLAKHVEQLRRADLRLDLPPIVPASRSGLIPLSFAQQRLWFVDQLLPGSSTYNVPAVWQLSGRFRFASFVAGVNEIVRRHESLRTTFPSSTDGPVQQIAPPTFRRPPVVDLVGLRPEDRATEARRLAAAEAWRSFDLVHGPLLRLTLVRLGEEETLALATLHHIVSDGWSLGVLGREIAVLEEAYASGRPSPLPELPVQYADFAIWQRRTLAGGAVEAEVRYWMEQLHDAPAVVELPLDRPRALTRTDAGAVRSRKLSQDLTDALKLLCRRQGATLFMGLLAGLQALLARYARKPDVSVGTPIAGRNHVEVEGLIGFFVNTLVLRARMEDDPSFQDLVQRVRTLTLDAHAHQTVPFEELVERLQPERSLAFTPLFQVMFVVQNNAGWGRGLAGLRARTADIESRTAKFDLTMSVSEDAGGLQVSLGYNTDLFDATTAIRLLGHLERLLATAVASPDLRISELSFLLDAERAHLLEWNDTHRPYPREHCLHELFAEQARLAPDRIAVVWPGGAMSYGELDRRANQLAHYLRGLGVGPETRVGLMLKRSPATILGILGIVKAGGAYVPLDPSYPEERLAFMIDDAELPVVLTERELAPVLSVSAARVVDLDRDGERIASQSEAAPASRVHPESLAYVMYTSGSTGRPKGVAITHRNVMRLVQAADYADLSGEESFLQLASISFDPSTLEIWGSLLHGGRLVLYPETRTSVEELAEALILGGVSSLWLTSGLFHQVVEERPQSLAPLRQLLAGGDVLSPRHVRRVFEEVAGVTLVNGYGPTENTTFTCCFSMTDAARVTATVPIGRPISNTVVYLLDSHLCPVPIGVAGELYTGGDGLARGYLNQPVLTAERFVPALFGEPGGRLYRTGDLARFQADGTIEFLGRFDSQIKVRGFRIELGEIESALAEYPLVRDAIVIVREESPGDRRLMAYVVPQEGLSPSPEELRGFLQEMLPDYMIPAAFFLMEAFPLTANGKVDRKALPRPEMDRAQSSAPFVAPRTPTEEVLALIWAELLRVERVGIHDNFFELGGHSLLATQVVSRTRSILELEVPVRAVFERPTVAGFAHMVEMARQRRGGSQPPPLEAVDRNLPLPLSFAQQRLWFLDQFDPGSPHYNVPLPLAASGPLQIGLFVQAIREVARRHEVLRTVFQMVEGRPLQVVLSGARLRAPVVDLGGLREPDRQRESHRLLREEAQLPFDLSRGPLLRLHLLRRAAEDHVILFNMHHIVSDARSIAVLMNEVRLLYGAFASGAPSPLPELPIQYADYAAWQRRWLQGEALDEQLRFWQESLGGLRPLELPTDRPRPPRPQNPAGSVPLSLPRELALALERLVHEERVTLFMILLAGFQTLLGRYSGQEDVAVGTPVAGRNRQEIENLIGFFVNLLVLRGDPTGSSSFRELLARVRQRTLSAYAHQDLPFERLVELLEPEREGGRPPLVQALVTLNRTERGMMALPDLVLRPLSSDTGRAKFDLALAIVEAEEGLVGTLEYDRELFDRTTIARLANHFTTLLTAAAERPDLPLAQVPLLTSVERHQLLREWGETGPATPPAAACLHQLFEAQAGRTPDVIALVCPDGERLTYAELDRRAARQAVRLRRLGVKPETIVGVCVERSAAMVTTLLGILKAGGAYLPLDPAYPRERLSAMLTDSGAAVLAASRGLQAIAEGLANEGLVILWLGPDEPADIDAAESLAGAAMLENLAYLIYTSGSTGRPKGIAIEHRSASALMHWSREAFCREELAGVLASTSICFDMSVFELFAPLAWGGTVILAENALALADLPAREEVTLVDTVPSAMVELLRQGAVPGSVRTVSLGGEPLRGVLARQVRALGTVERLLNLYGPSEDTTFSTVAEVGTEGEPTIGRVLANSRGWVLDGDLRLVPVGIPGELYLGGAGLSRGYLSRPDLTAERYLPDPFSRVPGERLYKTGDRVRWRTDGELEYLGRLDHQVKVRGFRVELGEIEAALTEHGGVHEAVVLHREDLPGGGGLIAYLVTAAAVCGSLRDWLQRKLPVYMVPSAFVALESLPLTPNGKVDRRALAARALMPERLGVEGSVAPRTLAEELLAVIWAQVLGLERVGVEDDFFALGGHSLLATQVVSRIRGVFGVDLPLRRLFESPTIAGLALAVAAAGPEMSLPLTRVDRQAELPLSFAQQRLWFLDQLQPGSALYSMPLGLRLSGELSVPALGASLSEVVRRHEVLRTVFESVEGRPVQRILPAQPLSLGLVDLSGLGAGAREGELQRLSHQEANRPFELSRGPLFRGCLVRLEETEHAVLLNQHHIVSDGWSLGLLVRESVLLYEAFRSGRPSPLAELPIQYADFAVWQRQWLTGEVLENQLAYWRVRLANLPALELPTDRPRPAIRTQRGAEQPFALPPEVSRAVFELGRREGVTTFILLQATFQALLSRYAGQEDVAVGTVVANRRYSELESLIGFFVNTLVLRGDLSGRPVFDQFLGQTREVALEAYAHQDIPFEQLVEELQPERDPSRTPLFQVMLVLQNAPQETVSLPGLEVSSAGARRGTAKFDLTLSLVERGGRLAGSFEYDSDLFDASTIARFGGHLAILLARVAEHPEREILDFVLLTPAERHQLETEWTGKGPAWPADVLLHEFFTAQARRTPEATALIAGTDRLSYRELDERSDRLARRLRASGVGAETRVGVFLQRTALLPVSLLAVLKAGGAYVPLDPAYPRERLEAILRDADAPVVVTEGALLGALPAGLGARMVLADEEGGEDLAESETPEVGPGRLAYVIYTSGSTGRPKGIAIEHRSASALMHWSREAFCREELAGVLASTSICFDMSVFELFAPLAWGGTVILAENALALADLPAREEVTLVDTVPSAMAELLRQGAVPGSVRTVNLGGEPLRGVLARQVHALGTVERLLNLYGPSEDTTFSTVAEVGAAGEPTIGRILANSRGWVLDGDLRLVPVGIPGELYLGGAGLSRGYLGRPELTAERYVPDPFSRNPGDRLYRTGDRVRWRADGELEYLGRLDHQVKVRGFRVELGEIEAVLLTQPAVEAAAVLALGEEGDCRLVAYVVGAPDFGALRRSLEEKLPVYMVPSAFVALESLPLLPNGKVDRRALAARAVVPERLGTGGPVAPRTLAEELLAVIWSQVLGVERVGVEDDFFDLGGHSLLATQVVSRIRGVFGVDLPLRRLFESPTIAGLALAVEAAGPETSLPLTRVDRQAELPLSFAQQRLWFLDQLQPGSALYNMPLGLRLKGELSVPALVASLGEVVRRHEVLRTVFESVEGRPTQKILPAQPLSLGLADLGGLEPGAREGELERLSRQEANRPFDLARGPLFRGCLLRLGEREHAVLLNQHHIVSDGWSLGLLVREAVALYEAFRSGHPSPLAEPPIQYADFAIWQRQWLTGEVLERQLAYWRSRLADLPVLELPTDRPRPAIRTQRGAEQPFALSAEVSRAVAELVRREGVTAFILLQAAFQALLSRYAGQEDVAVGTVVANRRYSELEGLIGFFVNTLVLRGDLSGRPTFDRFLRRTREVALEAYAHQDIPFEQLVEELQPERDPSRTPLFQVMLVLQNAPQEAVSLPGLEVSSAGARRGTAKFDLTLSLVEREGGLAGGFEYDSDLFDASTIARLGDHFTVLLSQVAERPEQEVADFVLLTAAERHQLETEWTAKRPVWPEDLLLHELFVAQARRTPEATALIAGVDRLSYCELAERSDRLARRLCASGVGAETRVGVFLQRTAKLPVALLGVLKAGGAYVPLDPAYPRERLEAILRDADAPVVVTEGGLLGALPAGLGARMVLADEDGAEAELETPKVGPGRLAYVIYTSGSTGRPKGIAIEHRSAAALMHWAREAFRPEELAGVLASTSICFDMSVFELFAPLAWGGTVILAENALALADLPAREEVTLVDTVPSAMAELLRQGAVPGSVKTVNLGGEPLRGALARQVHALGTVERLLNLYGPSEDTTFSTVAEVGAAGEPTIGRVLANSRGWVLDGDLRLVPVGIPGELYLGGAGLSRGYLGRPELTAERYVPDPFSRNPGDRLYRTGDQVRWRPDGELEYLGRLDHQVKVRGFRVELGEIEAVLLTQPAVEAAAVLVLGEEGDRRLVAYVVGAPDFSALRRSLEEKLPVYMVPSAFVALESLPLLPNGKVDRRVLAARAVVPERLGAGGPVGPRTLAEELLAVIWTQVLGVERVGVEDDFFDLGGHSLLATQVVSRIRGVFGVDLPLRRLFESPTIAGLALAVEAAGPEISLPLTRVDRQAELPLSFSQQRLWFLDQLQPGSALYNMPLGLRLKGELSVPALGASLGEVVRRHEVLRTVFESVEGRPVQKILPARPLDLGLVDLGGLEAGVREGELERLSHEEANRPFDLSRGPLLRGCLLRLGEREHVVLLNQHHIVSDGWSLGLLVREAVTMYEAFQSGKPSPLAELPIQYADFAVWQRQWLTGEVLDGQLAYWRSRLADLPVLELPTDRPRPAIQSSRGALHGSLLPAPIATGLRALSRAAGATPFMALLAAFELLLARHSGQQDFAVGIPIAGRRRAEIEGLIGFFINTLVLRADLSGSPDFGELLARVREITLGAYSHQDLPFEKILEELQPSRDLAHAPLFQVFFNMLNQPQAGARLPGLELEPVGSAAVEAKFDLTLYLSEEPTGGFRIQWVYNADLFDAARIADMARQLHAVLEQAIQDPGRSADRYSLLTAESQTVLPDLTAALPPVWHGAVHERFRTMASRDPDRPAVVDAQGSWSYRELSQRSNQLAHHLREAGIGCGDVVAIWSHRSAPFVGALLGTLEAGAAFVILDPAYPAAHLAGLLRSAGARAWLEVTAAGQPPLPLEDLLRERAQTGELSCRIALSGDGPEWMEVLAAGSRRGTRGATPAGPDDLAYLAFTSGSTGTPKGILGAHGPLSHFLEWHCGTFGLGAGDRFSLVSGLAHDPLLRDVFTPLWTGGTLHIPETEVIGNPGRLARWFAGEGITVAHLTPAMAQLVASTGAPALPRLRYAFFGGDVLTGADLEKIHRLAPAATLVNFYGATETPQAMGWRVADPAAGRRWADGVPVGRGIEGVQLLVLGRTGGLAGVGELGEIAIRTPYLAQGYLADPAATAERFPADPFSQPPGGRIYRTGDLGRYLPAGEVAFAGRADHQVKIRGFRIELGDIEAALASHPAVHKAAVLPHGQAEGRFLAAFVVPAEEWALDRHQLRAYLAERLPAYMLPVVWVELPELPLTPNGKLDRRALSRLAISRSDLTTETVPRTLAEELLAVIWGQVLGLERVGVQDNFFELGGHSLLATQVVSRIGSVFGVEMPLRRLFEAPTIAALAGDLEGAHGGFAPPPIARAPRDLELPLSYAQQRLWLLDQIQPGNTAYNLPFALRFSGDLEVPVLAASLTEVVRRNEVLRTVFVADDDRPIQRIQPAGPVPLPLIDLGGLPPIDREREAAVLAKGEMGRAFDLARGPLLRAHLVRLDEGEHAILLAQHHIVSDGWSVGLFLREIVTLYQAFRRGLPSPLREPEIQYADFAVWQRRWLSGKDLESQVAYWSQQLRGVSALEMPADRPRPAFRGQRGAHLAFTLDPALGRSLTALGRREGATLFMILLALFQTLLSRYSEQEDIAVGTAVANRRRAELEDLIGYFANTLVLRGDLSGGVSFQELLRRVREVALEAYAHQDVPFEQLVDQLQPQRDPSRTPLFQAMFVLQNVPREQLSLGEASVAPLVAEVTTAKFDLNFALSEGRDLIQGYLEYNTDLFDRPTVARLASHFANLAAVVAAAPGARLPDLDLLSAAERRQLLAEWNDTRAPFPETTLLHQFFEAAVERSPEAVAAVCAGRELTYAELEARSNRLAHLLRGIDGGVERAPVGVWTERSFDMLTAVLGVLKAGGHYVALDNTWPAHRVEAILAATGAPAIVVSSGLLAAMEEMRWRMPALTDVVCPDVAEPEPPVEALDPESVRALWDFVAERAVDRVTAGGFVSAFTGLPFSEGEVDEYRDRVLSLAAPWLRSEARVLEIGNGSGLLLWEMASRVAHVTGVDPSPLTQERNRERAAREGHGNVELLTGFAHEVDGLLGDPGDDGGRFDLVLLASTVQFFPGPRYLERVVRAALGRLAPGGAVLVGDVLDARRREELRQAVEEHRRQAGIDGGAGAARQELYLDEDLFRDLGAVAIQHRHQGFPNELRFRYDVLLQRGKAATAQSGPRRQRLWTGWHLDRCAAGRPPAVATPDDVAYVIHTSGSTGEPKGIVVQHRPAANLVDWINRTFEVGPEDRALFVTSLAFDLSVYDIFGLLAAGGTVHVATSEELGEPDRLADLLRNGGITLWDSAPAALVRLAPLFPAEPDPESRLRRVLLSGDWIPVTLPDRVRQAFPRAGVMALGGATEATVWSNWYPVGEVDPRWPSIPYGRPISNARYHVLDAGFATRPIGVPGDLYIGGDCLCAGYTRPDLTAAAFLPNPFGDRPGERLYRTGDRARYRVDGNLEFLGRLDHQVKVRGYRIELGEIELALLTLPGVRDAVVLAQQSGSERSDLQLVAYLTGDEKRSFFLREALQKALPPYMVPSRLVFLSELPLTANGKLDRKTLESLGRERQEARSEVGPRDLIELRLTQIWQELLSLPSVGSGDDFFELGGHSMLVVLLMARIEREFGRRLPAAILFRAPTVEALARILRQEAGESLPQRSLVAIRPSGARPPVYWVHPGGGGVLCYSRVAHHLGSDQPSYALQARALSSGAEPPGEDISAMAAAYVEELRAFQPAGPYRLGGWSLGGLIAYEMAQQLRRDGEEIHPLILIDTHPADPEYHPDRLGNRRLFATFARQIGVDPAGIVPSGVSLEGQEADDLLEPLLQWAQDARALPSDFSRDDLRRLFAIFAANLRAAAAYQLQPLDGRLVVFLASETLAERESIVNTWRSLARRGVEAVDVPGDHYTMLQDPQVVDLARRVQEEIARVKNP